MNKFLNGVVLLLACLAAVRGHAAEETYLSMGLGYEQSSGKYGTTSTTDSTSIPLHVLYEQGRWSLKLSVPYLIVTGDGSVVVTGGHGGRRSAATTTTTTVRSTRSGLGDVVAMATYGLLVDEAGESGLDAGMRVKFGTADKTLGTGLNDYAVQLAAYTHLGAFSPNLLLGYEMPGSSPDLPSENAAYGAVGASYALSDETRAGVEYWAMQRTSVSGYEQRELSFYASMQVGAASWLRVRMTRGQAEGSPDSAYGIYLTTDF